jgi:hypothetical protein
MKLQRPKFKIGDTAIVVFAPRKNYAYGEHTEPWKNTWWLPNVQESTVIGYETNDDRCIYRLTNAENTKFPLQIFEPDKLARTWGEADILYAAMVKEKEQLEAAEPWHQPDKPKEFNPFKIF